MLTIFQGRCGDHNDLAMPGALALGTMLAERTGLPPTIIGTPAPALSTGWQQELDAAYPALRAMSEHFHAMLENRARPLTALTRCAVSLATLPAVARHRPDACVVWFDAHADLNTPSTTSSGYLGGMALSGPAGLWDSGLGAGLPLSRIILVGQRDLDPAEQELIDSGRVTMIPPGPTLAADLRSALAGGPAYVHLDCDVLEPGIVPTDYRCDNGLSLDDLRHACAVIAEHELVGIEIAEFQHAWTAGGPPVSPAALLDAIQPALDRLQ
jgi:arginase family enzyme